MEANKVAVVILSYNTKSLLGQCIESVVNIEFGKLKKLGNLEVVVVDNGSTDGSREYLKKLQIGSKTQSLSFKVIFNKKNLGFAAGNNVGIKYAVENGAKWVMVLNSDTAVGEDFLFPLVKKLKGNSKVGIVSPKIYFAPGCEFHKDRYKKSERGKVIWSVGGAIDWQNMIASNRGVDEVDKGQYDREAGVDFASGCCLMASSLVWEKVNFFDERYFLYYEDSDLCQKVKKLGYRIVYIPGSKIWHANAGSSQVGGDLQDYFIGRNRLLFGFRWAPWRVKISLVKESWRILLTGRKWQKIGVKDFYLRRFGKGSWK